MIDPQFYKCRCHNQFLDITTSGYGVCRNGGMGKLKVLTKGEQKVLRRINAVVYYKNGGVFYDDGTTTPPTLAEETRAISKLEEWKRLKCRVLAIIRNNNVTFGRRAG